MNNKLVKVCRSILCSVMSFKLNGHNKIIAINSFAAPLLRYSTRIVNCSLNELDEFHYKARKLFTVYKGLHPKSDVHHLYLPKKLNIKQIVTVEKKATSHYVSSHCDQPLLKAV